MARKEANYFTFHDWTSSSNGFIIAKRTVTYPKQRYALDQSAGLRTGALPDPVYTGNVNITYDGFFVDNVRENVGKMMQTLYMQDGRHTGIVEDSEYGYSEYYDSYEYHAGGDTGYLGYRLACVTAAPIVEFLPNDSAAKVKITFACLPGIYITSQGNYDRTLDINAGETITITPPYSGNTARDTYPYITTTGHGTIWMRPNVSSLLDEYPGEHGYIITIDDSALFDTYTLHQDLARGRVFLRNTMSTYVDDNVVFPRVHWNRAKSNGTPGTKIAIPHFDAGFRSYNLTASGTLSGTIALNFRGF